MTIEKLGSRKFATLSKNEIKNALKKAKNLNKITDIPSSNDEQLTLLRNIAVASKGTYAFL
jgi:hypothetical protein